MIRTFTELSKIQGFNNRFEYLKLSGQVGKATFGYERFLNQTLYSSPEWKSFRREIILRDNGCDLGVEGFELADHIYVHHMNPITPEDIQNRSPLIFDPDNVITVSFMTHQAIHYGDKDLLTINTFATRTPNDTVPWRK